METMSPLDASFLHIEDAVSHMHIGSVAVFEGRRPPQADVLEAIEASCRSSRATARRCAFVPLQLGRPVWVDDPHFDLGYHLRHTALAAPGGDQELRNLVGRVMSQQLDRHKPLWEMWIVEGSSTGHWALVSKVHHCMVDGVSGTDLLTVVLDAEPDRRPIAAAAAWMPEPAPRPRGDRSSRRCARRSASRWARSRDCPPSGRARWRRSSATLAAALVDTGVRAADAPSSLNGPIGPHRRWDWAAHARRREDGPRAGSAAPSTTSCSPCSRSGFRDLLLSRDESVEGRTCARWCRSRCARPGERGTYNNRVSAMIAELPVGIDDSGERLQPCARRWTSLKESKQAVAGSRCSRRSGFAPSLLLALGTRVATRIPQRNVNTVTTNVPGPQHQLYLAGGDARGVPVRAAREQRARRRRDLLLQRHAQLRRHRRLRHRARHRGAVRRCGGRDDELLPTVPRRKTPRSGQSSMRPRSRA